MKIRMSRTKEKARKDLFSSESAASTIIAAVLLLSIIFTAFVVVRVAYVPEWKNDAEQLHMNEVQEDMTELKTMADTATFFRATTLNLPAGYSSLNSPSTTVRIRMGGGEVPIASPSRSSGMLSVNKEPCSAYLEAVTENDTIYPEKVECGGITYSSNNEQYVDQTLRYENGALILTQGDRSVMREPPLFTIRRTNEDPEDETGTFNFSISILIMNITSDPVSFSSEAVTTLRFNASDFKPLPTGNELDPVKSFKYTVFTRYPEAWDLYFNRTANETGFLYGTDYYITKGEDDGLPYVTFRYIPTGDKHLDNLYVNKSFIDMGSGTKVSSGSTGLVSSRQPPIAGFSFTPLSSGCAPINIQIVDESLYSKSYTYNFGDGTPEVTGAAPSHMYTTSGPFTITQTVTNHHGTQNATKQITIRHMPIANFTSDVTTGEIPLTVTFTDHSQYATGGVTWDFGDNSSTETGSIVTHEYTNPGTYTVTLTASNGFETNSTNSTIIAKQMPIAWFSASYLSGQAPLSVVFTDYSENADQWFWNFGDGSVSYAQNPEHTYTQVGTYSATLTVTNEYGEDTMLREITVTPQAPVADFTYQSKNGNKPLDISFIDLSTNSPTSWSWDFGDGNTSTLQNPVNSFSKSGRKTVTLTARNSGGASMKTKTFTLN